MSEAQWFKGKIGKVFKGGSYGRIIEKTIRTVPDNSRDHGLEVPADGLHVHANSVTDVDLFPVAIGGQKKKLSSGTIVFFQKGESREGIHAINVRGISPFAVTERVTPAQIAEAPAQSVSVRRGAAKIVEAIEPNSNAPVVMLAEDSSAAGKLEAAVTEIEDPFAHRDAEAVLVGTEAVLKSASPQTPPSSETTWEALKPVVDGIVGLLLKEAPIFLFGLVIDLGRWLWKTGKNFIADRRARKSAA